MRRAYTLFFLSLLLLFLVSAEQRRISLPDQSRIVTENGELVFHTGTNRTITFRSKSGGVIYLDNHNFMNIVTRTQVNNASIDLFQKMFDTSTDNVASRLTSIEDELTSLGTLSTRITSVVHTLIVSILSGKYFIKNLLNRMTHLEAVVRNNDNFNDLQSKITDLGNHLQALENQVSAGQRDEEDLQAQLDTLEQQITDLTNRMTHLQDLLRINECLSDPCTNGGTCVDLYNGYFCYCTSSWQGQRCQEDVDECVVYAGTDKSCHNGATCQNLIGSFQCLCNPNWYGVHCSEQHDDCTGTSNYELCGHGTCQNLNRIHTGQPKYQCNCDPGWKKNSMHACTVDIDECDPSLRPHCSVDPVVQCINVPGSYICGHCPTGYTGNGYYCNDINECHINNGGCFHGVQCINTRGSRTCGPCPPNFHGDGVTCIYFSSCDVNNGGCHHLATCQTNMGFGLTCQCPSGYVGHGIGSAGCVVEGSAAHCAFHPCQNGGRCVPSDGGVLTCYCVTGYIGPTCNETIDACASNPCKNEGTCTSVGIGYSCECTERNTGSRCERQQNECGGYLTHQSGSLEYPHFQDLSYRHPINCYWVITTNENQVIQTTFQRFNLVCNSEFLQIHDGSTASSPRFDTYCGTRLPKGGSFNSTHNQLYLWYKSETSVVNHGFHLHWTSHPPVCGGNLLNSNGSISSPGYPGNYPHNRDCVWTISVQAGSIIRFTFDILALERHQNCSNDYLEILDGQTDSDHLLCRFCSSTGHLPIQTTGPYAFIRFHSDGFSSDRGFRITYVALRGQGCGGDVTGVRGQLQSPGFPHAYLHDAHCVWVIRNGPGNNIELSFIHFDMQASSACSHDSLTVRDGSDQRANKLGIFCDSKLPDPITSSGNVMFIEMRTDAYISGTGFFATWRTVCGGTYTASQGVLTSPNWPNNYPSNNDCSYLIQADITYQVQLNFTHFGLDRGDDEECESDYIEIRDGGILASPLIGDRLCGTSIPSPIRSTGNMMFIRFFTVDSWTNLGFQAVYTTFQTECRRVLNSDVGIISSPNYPDYYPHGINCTWYISVNPGFIVQLTFNIFSLEGDCRHDYVEVYDSSSFVGRYCGSDIPGVITSTDNTLVVYMVTDANIAREGFSANYVMLNVSTACGSAFTASEGVITSPNYPNNYPHGRQCKWTITVADGHQILINITDFQIGNNLDFLELRNGGYLSSPLIKNYSENDSQSNINPILSHSNRLYIQFVTHGSLSRRGFRLEYTSGATGCGGDLTTSYGAIVSPNYPQPYGHNSECFWTITVSRGNGITLNFVDFDVEDSPNCVNDYLLIREEGSEGRILGKHCGNILPHTIKSKSNKLWLKYKTKMSLTDKGLRTQNRGFHIHYQSNCNLHLTGPSGVIESPNFPNAYPHHVNCTWIIVAPLGNKINMSFAAFHLQQSQNCQNDRLLINDGANSSDPVLRTLCGSNISDPFQSSGRHLRLNFVSDVSLAHDGFRLEWVVDGCGGNLNGETGVITSINYPKPYPHQYDCQWIITVQTGHYIKLNITDFDVQIGSHCSFNGDDCTLDALEVYAGRDDQGPRILRLDHQLSQPQVVHSTGNRIFVRFTSDSTRHGRGFNMSYTAVDGGCGGNFTARSAVLTTFNYPHSPDYDTECEYLITVTPAHTVLLNVTDVEGSSNCSYNYVSLYDGPDNTATLIASLCGHALPSPALYRSSSNQMFIRMRTIASIDHKGISAFYIEACGGTLNADIDGAIMSPGYLYRHVLATNCTWIISSQDNARRVSLTFTHMDLSGPPCSQEYVTVDDGRDVVIRNESEVRLNGYCGYTVPATITSYGSAMTVFYSSMLENTRTGFRAVYTSAYSACGGELSSPSGRFTSPDYPLSYPVDVECVWQIVKSPGNRVQLTFPVFDLDPNGDSYDDYLEIRSPDVNGQLIGRWIQNNAPDNLTRLDRLDGAWVRFRSNSHNVGSGFVAAWSFSYGGSLTGNYGQIASPPYRTGYSARIYTWTVLVSDYRRIRITFNNFILDSYDSYCRNYVEIFDGTVETGFPLGRFCGIILPIPVYSTTNMITVKFVSDYSLRNEFLLTWDGVLPVYSDSSGCGQLIAMDNEQNLTSPHNRDNCFWTIAVPQGNTVVVKIRSLYLRYWYWHHCIDSLTFYDGDSDQASPLRRYCESGNNMVVKSTHNMLGLKFTSTNSWFLRWSSYWYGRRKSSFFILYSKGCGGIMSLSAGSIKSLGYPVNYPANQNCTWRVTVQPGKTISLTFTSPFNISDSDQCNNDYLMLMNGYSIESPPLYHNGSNNTNGHYCGQSAPLNLETSSNYLTVRFISDGSGSAQGFSFNYTEISLACGGHLRLTFSITSGYFTSPKYPNDYPPNVDCSWVIIAPALERVQVDFEEAFYIQPHSGCQSDFIEFHDGGTINSPRIRDPLCGTTLPGTVRSTGNVLFARFRTDSNITHAGFRAKYSIASCGGRITGSSGVLTSPNFPASYSNNLDCEWVIVGPEGHYLVLNITNQNIQQSSNCTADFLEIRDGNATDSVSLHDCGEKSSHSVETSDSMAYVRFRSDSSGVATGFKITFQASLEECGGELNTPSGVITSPNFPGQYAHNRICLWNIIGPRERRVTLIFTHFHLQSSRSGSCRNDYVAVYNGIIPLSPLLDQYCGNVIPPLIESTSYTMHILFRTDRIENGGGFRAIYNTDNEVECGGYITDRSGNITSPGFFGGNYSNNLQCIWQFHNDQAINSSIMLNFTVMRLEFHPDCIIDFVEIREGRDINSPLVDQFCRHRIYPSPIIVVPSTDVWVRFRSDRSGNQDGFMLMYSFTNCGGVYTESQGTITSPNYPNDYDDNGACAWKISAPEGYRIKISFVDFSLENHTSCANDYVQIQNGGLPDSPVVDNYCRVKPDDFVSQSNELRLTMITDNSTTARGFQLNYAFQSEGCGGLYHGNQGDLSSPNFPKSYPHNTECRWDINVDAGFRVILNFNLQFAIAGRNNCVADYVEVLDTFHNGTMRSLGRWCEYTRPPSQRSTSNRMVVVFRSDSVSNGLGFSASWSSECGGVYSDLQGTIVSPRYPNRYPNNMHCTYTISLSTGKHIALTFKDFELEGGRNCYHDYVKIRYYTFWLHHQNYVLFCGSGRPNTVTDEQEITFQFHSDGSGTYHGFMASYYSEDCGGNFTEPTGFISTPLHPFNYHKNLDCSWSITVAPNRIIKFRFATFHTEDFFDYVKIYDGPNTGSHKIGTYSGSIVPDVIFSTSNRMYIHFTADRIIQAPGFSGVYWTTYGPAQGCGGTLRRSSGKITSVDGDGDGQYEDNLDCEWLIYVSPNKVITFNITGFDLQLSTGCTNDSLKIYDGQNKQAVNHGPYCGQTLPPSPIITSSNAMLVVFTTDDNVTGAGFNMSFRERNAVCGGVYSASDEPQVIKSPNYPNSYGLPIICPWTIDSGASNLQIRVSLTDLQLQPGSCDTEYLLVSDEPLGSTGQEFHYCGSNLPAPFDSGGQRVKITFRLSDQTSSRGFRLTYEIADCNKNFSLPSGRITSPGFPGNYQHSAHCTIRVTSPEGTKLSFYFSMFNVEQNYDKLLVFNSSSSAIASLHGDTLPSPFFLNDNVATLIFETDGSDERAGYDITFTSTTQSPGCGGNITGIQSGVITSPSYPSNFSQVETCTWHITPPARRILYWKFTELFMPDSPSDCDKNYITVGLMSQVFSSLPQYCQGTGPAQQISETLAVNYISSGVGSAPVFKLQFSRTNNI